MLCTHLHADHVGWNTMLRDGRWVPTFPNAKYLFSRTENEIGNPDRNPAAEADPQRNRAYRDSVLPVIEAGQAVLLDGAHAIDDTMLIEPAPGHTPGHVILKLADRGEHAVVCGDAIHHPLQVYAPHWNSGFCELPEQARITRRRVLEHCAEHKALLFPVHFGAPHVAAIEQAGGRVLAALRRRQTMLRLHAGQFTVIDSRSIGRSTALRRRPHSDRATVPVLCAVRRDLAWRRTRA